MSAPDLKTMLGEIAGREWLLKHAKFCDNPDCFQCEHLRVAKAALVLVEAILNADRAARAIDLTVIPDIIERALAHAAQELERK